MFPPRLRTTAHVIQPGHWYTRHTHYSTRIRGAAWGAKFVTFSRIRRVSSVGLMSLPMIRLSWDSGMPNCSAAPRWLPNSHLPCLALSAARATASKFGVRIFCPPINHFFDPPRPRQGPAYCYALGLTHHEHSHLSNSLRHRLLTRLAISPVGRRLPKPPFEVEVWCSLNTRISP